MDLFQILKKRSSYIVPEEGYVADLQGWMPDTFPAIFRSALGSMGKTVEIVEVGSWKGTSAIEMASICAGSDVSAKIICVDTWLGSPEHFTDIGNYQDLHTTFVKNVKSKDLGDVIVPLAMPSLQAVEVLKKYRVRPDIVYIDAAHEYLPVRLDIEAYWEILKPGGIMIGDDYSASCWPGVVRAVNEFSITRNLQMHSCAIEPTWVIKKTDL